MSEYLFMDAWHPAVNPSSRMPIHHARYVELFGDYLGVLNEFPRKYGSSTIREMIINQDGTLNVVDLNVGLKWMPWWICSDSEKAHTIISKIFDSAINNVHDKNLVESYQCYLSMYERLSCKEKTMGEVAYEINNKMFNEIVPVFQPKLVSFYKSDIFKPMYDTLSNIGEYLYSLLDRILAMNQKKINNMLAIYMDVEGEDWHVSYEFQSHRFVIYSLDSPKRKKYSDIKEIISLFNEKKVLLGSLLTLIIEEYMASSGDEIIHFGNTYGRIEQICKALETDKKVYCLNDDEDSWNYANFEDVNGYIYPIHLLESFAYRNTIRDRIKTLIESSVEHRATEIIKINRGDNIVASICN